MFAAAGVAAQCRAPLSCLWTSIAFVSIALVIAVLCYPAGRFPAKTVNNEAGVHVLHVWNEFIIWNEFISNLGCTVCNYIDTTFILLNKMHLQLDACVTASNGNPGVHMLLPLGVQASVCS